MLWLALAPAFTLCTGAAAHAEPAALARAPTVNAIQPTPASAPGSQALDSWRRSVDETRLLAENDLARAHAQARQLQATLPAEATEVDQARLWNLLARIEVYLALTEAAAEHSRRARTIAERHGDLVGQAEADLNDALNLINQGKLDSLVDASSHGLKMLEGVDRPELMTEALLRAAMMYRRIGQLSESVALCVQSMSVANRTENPLAKVYAHQCMGVSYEQSDHPKEASQHYAQMLKHARLAQSRQLEAFALMFSARHPVDGRRDLHRIQVALAEAAQIFRAVGAPFNEGFALFAVAENLRTQGRHTEALAVLNQVAAIYRKYPNRIGLWYTLNARSEVHETLGHLAQARADAQSAYALAQNIGFARYQSESAQRMAALAAGADDYRGAHRYALEASQMTTKAARDYANARIAPLAQYYETQNRQREINDLTRLNERQAAELRQRALERTWLWTVLMGSALALSGTSWLLWRLRRSQREQREAQDRLQDQSRILRSVLNNMGEGLVVCDQRGEVVLLNPVGEALLGKPPNRSLATWTAQNAFYQAGQATPMPHAELPLRKAIAGHASDAVEIYLRALGADTGRWLSITARPLLDQSGNSLGAVAVYADISVRKQTEAERLRMLEELTYRERQFRTLAENLPDAIARYNLDSVRVYANPAFVRARDMTPEMALGVTPEVGWHCQDLAAADYMVRMQRVMRTGQADEFPIRVRPSAAHPQTRVFLLRIIAEHDPQGQVLGVMSIGRDVSAMQAMQDQLRTSRDLLRQLGARAELAREDERKRIARELHDELGQLLTSLRLRIATAPQRMAGGLVDIRSVAHEMTGLLDQTIAVVRGVVTQLRPAALDAGYQTALTWLGSEFRRDHGVRCELHLEAAPQALDDARATTLFRVAQESLTNVARHAGARQVDIAIEQIGGDLVMRIGDDGRGFDVAASKPRSYGLVGMRERALTLGGELSVSSEPGQGTVVQLRLPMSHLVKVEVG